MVESCSKNSPEIGPEVGRLVLNKFKVSID